MEKLKSEHLFGFLKKCTKVHFYVITDDFGGKNEKKW